MITVGTRQTTAIPNFLGAADLILSRIRAQRFQALSGQLDYPSPNLSLCKLCQNQLSACIRLH